MSNLSQFAIPVKNPSTGEITNQTFNLPDSQNGISDIVNVLGAKNLLKISASNMTLSGVTFTVNSDTSISVNGTATSDVYYSLGIHDFGNVSFSTDGSTNNSKYKINGLSTNSQFYLFYNATNNYVNIVVKSGYTVDNVRVYPMIRPSGIEDTTYVPYAKTNRELTLQQHTFVGTCASAANEQHKVVTVDEGFVLEKGVRIAVKFSNNNSYKPTSSTPPTLNVNGTGAKSISLSGNSAYTTDSNGVYLGNSGQYTYYIYDGTYWIWEGISKIYYQPTLSVAQLTTGTDGNLRLVRADYLHQGISEMIEEGITGKANSADLAEVATSGSFNDLSDVPTFPTAPTELVVNVAANATSAAFTNAAITSTATYDVYTSVFTSIKGMSISGTTLTVTLKPVSSAMQVKLRIS